MFMREMSEKSCMCGWELQICSDTYGNKDSLHLAQRIQTNCRKVIRMITVTAGIIRQHGTILICQRGAGGNCAFLWEFPGGKLEPGETMEECLIRECKEELDVQIIVQGIFSETTYRYPDREIAFTFFNAAIVSGDITLTVHQQICWVSPDELKGYEFCPADVEVVKLLCSDLAQ